MQNIMKKRSNGKILWSCCFSWLRKNVVPLDWWSEETLKQRAKNVSNLHCLQVLKFTQQQRTLVATMRRFSVMKKESSITRDIKLQAESLHRRLDALSKQAQRTEEQQGPAAVATRIQRSQHAALHRQFQQVGNITSLPLCFYVHCIWECESKQLVKLLFFALTILFDSVVGERP